MLSIPAVTLDAARAAGDAVDGLGAADRGAGDDAAAADPLISADPIGVEAVELTSTDSG